MNDVVCIYSGGMDSFTMVNDALAQGRLHSCLSFNYGQRHFAELVYAARYTDEKCIAHHIIDLTSLTPHLLGSALTDDVAVPEGHYEDTSMKLTVVPNRNMIMLSIAIAYAVSHRLKEVWFGAQAGDRAIYPDCRVEFVTMMNTAAQFGNWHPVQVRAPYLKLNKEDILRIGFELDLDYAKSWTCYIGGALACGKCGACQERLEAFRKCGVKDPLEYAA